MEERYPGLEVVLVLATQVVLVADDDVIVEAELSAAVEVVVVAIGVALVTVMVGEVARVEAGIVVVPALVPPPEGATTNMYAPAAATMTTRTTPARTAVAIPLR